MCKYALHTSNNCMQHRCMVFAFMHSRAILRNLDLDETNSLLKSSTHPSVRPARFECLECSGLCGMVAWCMDRVIAIAIVHFSSRNVYSFRQIIIGKVSQSIQTYQIATPDQRNRHHRPGKTNRQTDKTLSYMGDKDIDHVACKLQHIAVTSIQQRHALHHEYNIKYIVHTAHGAHGAPNR